MLKKSLCLLLSLSSLLAGPAEAAGRRYSADAPVLVGHDVSSPWIAQLVQARHGVYSSRRIVARPMLFQSPRPQGLFDRPRVVAMPPSGGLFGSYRAQPVRRVVMVQPQGLPMQRPQPRLQQPQGLFDRPRAVLMPQSSGLFGLSRAQPVRRVAMMQPQSLSMQPQAQQPQPQQPQTARREIDPVFLPQTVAYETGERPGTIVIDTENRFLYLVQGDGTARRYGVGVGKPGFEWRGEHSITRKQEWPTWNPPAEMRAREAAKGHILPVSMEGGLDNPLGARAMYLGSTLYRIHGTNAPWTIGYAVSSGCIRMRNEDVVDLYDRVEVGTRVVVL